MKKVHSIAGRFIVCIDENFAKKLSMDKDVIWLEQELVVNSIVMRVRKFPILNQKDPSS